MPSGLAAVLFGVMPLYSATIASVALADEPLRARLVAGIGGAIGGLALAFGESLALGDAKWALLAATACAHRAAVRRDRQRGDQAARPAARPDRAERLGDARRRRAAARDLRAHRGLGQAAWTAQSLGSIAYLAVIGSAVPFVTLTILLSASCRP